MKKITRRLRVAGILGLLFLLLLLPVLVFAQDDGEEDSPVCNPVMMRLAQEMSLAQEMDVTCESLAALQTEGVGLGQIMKAWHLSGDLEGFGDDWKELLIRKQEEGIGWGQFKMAQRLAGAEGEPGPLLDLKQKGFGWGHIKKAIALAAAGFIDFDDAIGMAEGDLDWDAIREANDLPPGPPPWASSGKDKTDQGPPPWANAGGKDKDKNQDDE